MTSSVLNEINKRSKLQSLNLDQNRLQKFPEVVTQLSYLRQLHLDNNQIRLPATIKNLIELGQLTFLTELHRGKNIVHQLPSELGNLKRLVSLNPGHNHLTKIPSQILDLRQLETLNLEGNVRSNIMTDFGKLLTSRVRLEVALEQADVAQERSEALR